VVGYVLTGWAVLFEARYVWNVAEAAGATGQFERPPEHAQSAVDRRVRHPGVLPGPLHVLNAGREHAERAVPGEGRPECLQVAVEGRQRRPPVHLVVRAEVGQELVDRHPLLARADELASSDLAETLLQEILGLLLLRRLAALPALLPVDVVGDPVHPVALEDAPDPARSLHREPSFLD